ncbi:MAG: hypothetical protein ABIP54_04240 [Candidatus Andersenbacteria bacterium]
MQIRKNKKKGGEIMLLPMLGCEVGVEATVVIDARERRFGLELVQYCPSCGRARFKRERESEEFPDLSWSYWSDGASLLVSSLRVLMFDHPCDDCGGHDLRTVFGTLSTVRHEATIFGGN